MICGKSEPERLNVNSVNFVSIYRSYVSICLSVCVPVWLFVYSFLLLYHYHAFGEIKIYIVDETGHMSYLRTSEMTDCEKNAALHIFLLIDRSIVILTIGIWQLRSLSSVSVHGIFMNLHVRCHLLQL